MLKDKPHAWNEVFLNGKWFTVDLDPTYRTYMGQLRTSQNTKMQKNTFIIHENKNEFERS